jgi:type II secretory pathway component PulF
VTAAYRYRAATTTGAVVEGVVRAGSPRDALDELRRQTLVPVSVEPVAERTTGSGSMPRISRRDALATSMRTVATLLGAGMPLDRALDFAASHAGQADVAAAWRAVLTDVQSGVSFGESVRKQVLFGTFAGAIVRAGEESGQLDSALARLADHFERTNELASQLRGALLYPMLMGVVSSVGVVVLLAFVVPRFVAMLADVGGTLPLSTRMLVGASSVVTRGWWIWGPLLLLLIFGTRQWLMDPANRKRWHAARLRIPVAGPVEAMVQTSRFARALGVLLKSGTPMLNALRLAREVMRNDALAGGIDEAVAAVGRGDRVADALAGHLPPLAVQLLAAGEESGNLDAMCERVADVYDGDVQRSLRTLVRLVEPVLIVTFGLVVGFIALAMLQAMYSINAAG